MILLNIDEQLETMDNDILLFNMKKMELGSEHKRSLTFSYAIR